MRIVMPHCRTNIYSKYGFATVMSEGIYIYALELSYLSACYGQTCCLSCQIVG